MGIVSTVKTVDEPQLMVGPLDLYHDDAVEDAVHVAPLTRPKLEDSASRGILGISERAFQLQTYSTKISDMSRIPGDPFFEAVANSFRSTAATKRVVPFARIVVRLSEGTYKRCLNDARSWAYWTTTDSSKLITEVRWTSTAVPEGLTVMQPGEAPQSLAIEHYWSDTTAKFEAHVFSQRRLEPLEVPFGVDPACVVMRQQVRFVKGAFALTIGRSWSGGSNAEVEECLLKTRGQPVAILDMTEPDVILQTRCTDAQLGNALEMRLP
jgi:hypothetical protein